MATAGFNSVGAVIGGAPKFSPAGMIGLKPPQPPAPSPITAQAVHPGMIPSTPVKSITAPDGSKTDFHAPPKETTGTTPGVLKPVVNDYKDQPSSISADQTPSSATQPNVSAPTSTPPDTTYPGMIGGAVSAAQGNQAIGQSAKDIANKYSGLISNEQQNLAGQLGGIETSGTTLQTALGREGVLNRTSLARQQALGTQMGNELQGTGQQLTAQQQQQSGMVNAAGLTPNALRYGGAAGGTMNPIQAIPTYAQDVVKGRMTIDQANAALGGDIGMTTALRNEIQKTNPDFNFTQSAASAKTLAEGQTLETASKPAIFALDQLQNAYSNLGPASSSNVPFFSNLAQNWAMQTGIGRDQVSSYLGALNEARSKISGVLSSIIGVDQAGRQANTLLPDGMTPSEVPAKIQAAKEYLANQVESYKGSGATQNPNIQTNASKLETNPDGTLKAVSF